MDKLIHVRVTDEQRKFIRMRAAELDMRPSELIRKLIDTYRKRREGKPK